MNASEKKDIKTVIFHLEQAAVERKNLTKNVNRIGFVLEGDPDDHKSDGIVGDVNRNTAFRMTGTKLLWLFATALIGLAVKMVFFAPVAAITP